MTGPPPLQTLGLAALLVVERAGLVLSTSRRGRAISVAGWPTALGFLVCYLGVLALALLRLDLFGEGVSRPRAAVGLSMVAGGVLLRLVSLRRLGRHFSEWIVIREEHALVTSGPYRVLRHPLHAGFVLIVAGMAALAGGLLAWFLALLCAANALVRERHEERVLLRRFGEAWDRHAARTFGLTDLLGGR